MFEKNKTAVIDSLLPREAFHPFPGFRERDSWNALPVELADFLIRKGEGYLGYDWPVPLASMYMEFCRNGNRTHYEQLIFQRRRLPLQYLVAAECCEGKGRFVDDIINGVWATLDEASWVIPAHNNPFITTGSMRPLPDTEDPDSRYIDLFAAECGAVLAWVYACLGQQLGEQAEQVPKRLLGELERRIFTPFLQHKDFDWMGYHGNPVNNWNPWILSNILTAAGLACMDEQERAAIIAKCIDCLEFFVNGYAVDGGCDEGPGYWNAAGGALFDCVDILCDLTGGRVDSLWQDEKLHNICTYICKMQISGRYFVNYADASPVIAPDAQLIYRIGRRLGDRMMTQMGAAAYQQAREQGRAWEMNGVSCQIYRRMKAFFADRELAAEGRAAYPLVREAWFAGIQVMAARMQAGSSEGLYLSAKGGHNGESHNHNDVGSFLVYCDGKPVVVDIGLGVYEKNTFNERRYEILQMQSLYHNLPVIWTEDGPCGQCPGREYAAEDVFWQADDGSAVLRLDLRHAYPASAGIVNWKRSFTLDRVREQVVVADDFRLARPAKAGFVLMTPVKPVWEDHTLTVTIDGETAVSIRCDQSLCAETEPFDTSKDAKLTASWGSRLYRTVLRTAGPVEQGSFSLVFTKA